MERNKSAQLFLTILLAIAASCSPEKEGNMVLVEGGIFVNEKSNLYEKKVVVSDFYIGRYEVTQKEWVEIMGSNPSGFKGENLPVEMVSWYDCVEYCNKRSEKEGFQPYYHIEKDSSDLQNINEIDSIKWLVTMNPEADGYRLPTEVEWEYAASGGAGSESYTYSGADEVDEVAWYWRNSGDKILEGSWMWNAIESNNGRTHPVGEKSPNELGIYDMSGNVREWCSDWYEDHEIKKGIFRVQRGGGWLGADYRCAVNNRHYFDASGRGPDQGFRVCRSARGHEQ